MGRKDALTTSRVARMAKVALAIPLWVEGDWDLAAPLSLLMLRRQIDECENS